MVSPISIALLWSFKAPANISDAEAEPLLINTTKVFPFSMSPSFANHFLFSFSFLDLVETISPFERKKSEIFIAWESNPPGLFLKSNIYPLIFLSLSNSFIFFLTCELLFSLKAVNLIYPIFLSIFFDLSDWILIIFLVILKT